MKKIERYEVVTTQDEIQIVLNQKKSAIVNLIIGVAVSLFGLYLIMFSQETSSFYYVMIVIGILWTLVSYHAYNSKRDYKLTKHNLVFNSSSKKEPITLAVENFSHLNVHRIRTKRGKNKLLPWHLKFINDDGVQVMEDLTFQEKKNVETLASRISSFYKVKVKYTKD